MFKLGLTDFKKIESMLAQHLRSLIKTIYAQTAMLNKPEIFICLPISLVSCDPNYAMYLRSGMH